LGGSGQFMYYVYILHSKQLNKKYIGFTSDLKNRIQEHKRGDSNFTSRTNDWKLIYYECFLSKIDAKEEEKFLKSGKGRERIKYLLKKYFGEFA
jgi:putative endonuclease